MPEFRKYGTDPKMDKLVDSDDWKDREAAVYEGYGLEKLINDKDFRVRMEVPKQGYGLDILVNDENACVRQAVAYQGYGLDKFINDENDRVRTAVVIQGYYLDVLINDESDYVRDWISRYLEKHGYKSIDEWAIANPDRVRNTDPQYFKIKEDLKDFIYKIDDSPKLKVESSYDNIDEFFDSYVSNSNSDDFDELVICAVDTKIPLIKIQKTQKENKTEFKFLVDINNEDGDSFTVKTTIKSKEQLNSKIQETVEALRLYQEFNKYADDLEDCL